METLIYKNDFNEYLKSEDDVLLKNLIEKINKDISLLKDDAVIHISNEYYLHYIYKEKLIKPYKIHSFESINIYPYDILNENAIHLALLDIKRGCY